MEAGWDSLGQWSFEEQETDRGKDFHGGGEKKIEGILLFEDQLGGVELIRRRGGAVESGIWSRVATIRASCSIGRGQRVGGADRSQVPENLRLVKDAKGGKTERKKERREQGAHLVGWDGAGS